MVGNGLHFLAGNQLYEREKTGKGAAAVHKVLSKQAFMSKKPIDIFNFKQQLLSIDIKTKVIQHVERE